MHTLIRIENERRTAALELTRAARLIADIEIPGKPSILKKLEGINDIVSMSKLVIQDTALSAAVMKVINSAWLAIPNPVHRIDQAVFLLGLQNTHTITKAVCFQTVTDSIAEPKLIKQFWKASVNTAICMRTLAKFLHLGCKDTAYACGLFHNAGLPILSSHFRNMMDVVESAYLHESGDIERVERSSIGVSRAEVSSRLALEWEIPAPIPQALLNQHAMYRVDLSGFCQENHLIVLLKLAEYISAESETSSMRKNRYEWRRVMPRVLEYTALTPTDLNELSDICSAQLQAQ